MSLRWGHSPLMWPKKLSIQAWSVGVRGRPWCWAMATAAMKARVSVEIMGPPLSDTASRIGRRGSSRGRSRRSSVNRSVRPSTARASSNTTRTWVEDSSDDATVEIQRRLSVSTMAKTQRRARPKWVTSHIQVRLGSRTSHDGHGRLGSRRRGGAWATMSPFESRTRLNVDGDTHTRFS